LTDEYNFKLSDFADLRKRCGADTTFATQVYYINTKELTAHDREKIAAMDNPETDSFLLCGCDECIASGPFSNRRGKR